MSTDKVAKSSKSPLRKLGERIRLGISAKIIMPYLIITVGVAIVGTYVVTWLVAGSWVERFENQLVRAGQAASDNIVRAEKEHLAILRQLSYTTGVGEAIQSRDRYALDELLRPAVVNVGLDAMEVTGVDGYEILGLFRRTQSVDPRDYEWQATSDLSGWNIVQKIAQGHTDQYGDKFVTLAETTGHGLIVYTGGPVKVGDRVVGVILVGTYIDNFVRRVAAETLADVTFYGPDGRVIATTFVADTEDLEQMALSPALYQLVLADPNSVHFQLLELARRQYRLAFGPMRIRNEVIGVYSVAFSTNFVVQTASTSRNLFAGLFTLAALLVIVLGYVISRLIIRPILRLVQTSRAVAAGDLEQSTGIVTDDEIGVLATSFDHMTESLRQRTKQLMEEASKVRAILSSIADGVLVLDLDGNVITMNQEGERIISDMIQDFMAGRLREFQVGGEDAEGAAKTGLPWDLVSLGERTGIELRRFEAGDRVFSALAAPVITEKKETIGTVVVFRDITRDVEVDRLKDEFIANISHELRSPLTSVKGYCDLLKMAGASMSEQQRSFLSIIEANVGVLIEMINQLIDLSQIEAGTFGLVVTPVSLTRLVAEATARWHKQMADKGLSLVEKLPDDALEIRGDEARLRWALDNLLSNAYNYTPAGGCVTVEARGQDGQVFVEVGDTGIGISEADQQYLFTRFFRAAHEEVMKVRGVGLGLYVVKAVAEAHGGHVQVHSKPGVGSVFTVALPVQGPLHAAP
jgi:signal transduction histidine kinase